MSSPSVVQALLTGIINIDFPDIAEDDVIFLRLKGKPEGQFKIKTLTINKDAKKWDAFLEAVDPEEIINSNSLCFSFTKTPQNKPTRVLPKKVKVPVIEAYVNQFTEVQTYVYNCPNCTNRCITTVSPTVCPKCSTPSELDIKTS